MSSVVISGDTSGAITLASPAVAGTNTITLPASTGTVVTTGSPQSGGVIQTVYFGTASAVSTSGGTQITTGVTATITPKFATSKILVFVNIGCYNGGNNSTGINLQLYKNGSGLVGLDPFACYIGTTTGLLQQYSNAYLDSPATTSATTYTVYFARNGGLGTVTINNNNELSTIVLQEIAA